MGLLHFRDSGIVMWSLKSRNTEAVHRCSVHGKAFDQRLMAELSHFGQHYADIGALVYRQAGRKKRYYSAVLSYSMCSTMFHWACDTAGMQALFRPPIAV